MNLSTYCLIFPSEGHINSFLIFSTKKAAIAEVPATLLRRIQKGQHIPEKDKRLLNRLGLLVADPVRERKRMSGYIDGLNRASRFLSIKLVMNLDCNLNCRYCFEGNRKGKFYMTKETADRFVEFVRVQLAGKIEEVFITFYGGEPLLSKQLIVYIAKKLKNTPKRRDVSFRFALQTNGTLITPKTVHELKPLGLAEAYLTVDGPKENHDTFRPYKSGEGSFNTVMKNIHEVCDLVSLRLVSNYTKNNYRQFPGFLDYLISAGLTPQKIRSADFFTVVATPREYLPDFRDGCSSQSEPWLGEACIAMREETLKRGFEVSRLLPVICMMHHENNLLVNHDGRIYKCPNFVGQKEFCVGDIWCGIGDYHASHHIDNWKNEACLSCTYLPLCFGGCCYMKYISDGNMDSVDCKKTYLDATLEAMVKQDIRYGLIG